MPLTRADPRTVFALAVGAGMAVAGIGVALVVWSFNQSVTVDGADFDWSTPPTQFCPYMFTTGNAGAVLHERLGSTFDETWGVGCSTCGTPPCEPGNGSGASYVITSIASSTFGFTVVSSNVPFVFGYDRVVYFNVSVRAPDWPAYTILHLSVTGGLDPTP
jgi:hypothetical protein